MRFETDGGKVFFGEAPSSDVNVGDSVQVYEGDEPWSLVSRGGQARIAKVSHAMCLPSNELTS